MQWFTGGKPSWVEGVVIAVVALFLFIVVGILVKLARMFGCLFKCITCFGMFKKKSNDVYDKVRVRADSYGRYRRQASEKVKSVIPARRPNSRSMGPPEDSLNDDLHYIVVNDSVQNEYETLPSKGKVRFDSNQFFTSKKWAF